MYQEYMVSHCCLGNVYCGCKLECFNRNRYSSVDKENQRERNNVGKG